MSDGPIQDQVPKEAPDGAKWLVEEGYKVYENALSLDLTSAMYIDAYAKRRNVGWGTSCTHNDTRATPNYSSIIDRKHGKTEGQLYTSLPLEQRRWHPRQMAKAQPTNTTHAHHEIVLILAAIHPIYAILIGFTLHYLRSVNPKEKPFGPKSPFTASRQLEHTDYRAHSYLGGSFVYSFSHWLVPLSCIIGLEDEATHIWVRPYSHTLHQARSDYYERPMIKVYIPKGAILFFRGDLYHRGGRYNKENRRGHGYVWFNIEGGEVPGDRTYPRHGINAGKAATERECAGSDDEYK